MKWPYDDKKRPPERIYLGRNTENEEVIVSWWIWPTMDDDVCYIRSDIVRKELRAIKQGAEDGSAVEASICS